MAWPVSQVVEAMVASARAAGEAIRREREGGDLGVRWKDPGSPVTSADVAAERTVRGVLRERLGAALRIVGEESVSAIHETACPVEVLPDGLPDETWSADSLIIWVDPLDATGSFLRGRLDRVTVLIGASVDGEARAGVIHRPWPEPAQAETVWGVVGWGVHGMEVRRAAAEPTVLLTSQSHMNTRLRRRTVRLGADRTILDSGSGHKALRLLGGDASIYVYPVRGYKRWDACAPEAIIRAAGGHYTDRRGEALSYSDEGSHVLDEGMHASLGSLKDHMTAARLLSLD